MDICLFLKVLYYFHSHSNLKVGMVCICLFWLSNRSVIFPLVYMMGVFVIMSLSRLHSLISSFT
jgi:hypothetical protein